MSVYSDKPGFTKDQARKAWKKAAATSAAAVTLVAELRSIEDAGLIAALRNGNEAVQQFPNWENLFNAGDICDCEKCRSVYSPAAYFADLLLFLRYRKANDPAFSAKDILFNRRPDLGYLALNCENAHITLPYIDVVCEVLEAAVAEKKPLGTPKALLKNCGLIRNMLIRKPMKYCGQPLIQWHCPSTWRVKK